MYKMLGVPLLTTTIVPVCLLIGKGCVSAIPADLNMDSNTVLFFVHDARAS